MCHLICDVITCCVLSCETGKINAYDKSMLENQKKEKKRHFSINLHFRNRLDIEFSVCLGYVTHRLSNTNE